MENNFISSIDNDKECVMHSKSDNIEIMINEDTDEVVKEPFDSIKINLSNSLFKLWSIEKDLQRITQIKPFINKYNWERI